MNDKFEMNFIEIEEKILNIILSNPTKIDEISEKLQKEDFSNNINRQIYQTMLELHYDNSIFDVVTLIDALNKKGVLKGINANEKIFKIAQTENFESLADNYIKLIKEKTLSSKVLNICNEIETAVTKGQYDYSEIIDFVNNKVSELNTEKLEKSIVSLSSIVSNINKSMTDALNNLKPTVEIIKTKYTYLDTLITGLKKSDLIILAARPSVGKTAFSLNLAINAATQEKKVLIFSLEMGEDQLANRILSTVTGIPLENLINNKVTAEDVRNIAANQREISKLDISISTNSSVTILDIKNEARKFKKDYGLDLIIIDYLQLITPIGDGNRNREQQVAEISRNLKILAKELNVPIVTLAQLSRHVETRADKTPVLSDLRESGSIEQDADIVIFLSREKDNEKAEEVVVNVSKNRNGQLGHLKLHFDLKRQKFDNFKTTGEV